MPIRYKGLSKFDFSTVKFLKIKAYKSLPGGIFTLIFQFINLAVFLTIVFVFIFEPRKMRSQISAADADDLKIINQNQINSKINITITSVIQETTTNSNGIGNDSKEGLDYINSHYKLIEYYKKSSESMDKIYARLYKGSVITQPPQSQSPSSQSEYALSYSIPSSDIISKDKDADFPRIGLESCAFLKSSTLPFFLILENPEILDDCIIDPDPLEFYSNPLILNKAFIFHYSTDYHILEPDYKIKSSIKTYDLVFSFAYDQIDSYITELNRLAFMTDGDDYAYEYINWLYPDHQVLSRFTVNSHYSFHILCTTDYNDLAILFIFYKNGFLYYLQLLGSSIQVVDILMFIPALWTPYYASLVIIKYYVKKKRESTAHEAFGTVKRKEETGNEREFDWENMKYCEWLAMRFGCSARSKRLNEELINMRFEAIQQYEKLYSDPNRDRITISTTELQNKGEVSGNEDKDKEKSEQVFD